MQVLDLITILCTGLLIGNELSVSLFVNPAIWQLEESAQAKSLSLLARSLGTVMPFWYAFCLILFCIEAYLRRHEPAFIPILIAIGIWIGNIVYTLAKLVPINNSIAALQSSLPAGWRHEHKHWDTLHRWRILLIVTAMVSLTYGILGSR